MEINRITRENATRSFQNSELNERKGGKIAKSGEGMSSADPWTDEIPLSLSLSPREIHDIEEGSSWQRESIVTRWLLLAAAYSRPMNNLVSHRVGCIFLRGTATYPPGCPLNRDSKRFNAI